MKAATHRWWIVLITVVFLTGCASTRPPAKPSNLCSIFKEKRGWYKDAKKANDRWGTPIQIMMAIMHQESSFRHDVRPPRPWFLFIPLPRNSSAYGYPQAQDPVWEEYLDEAGGFFSSREDFGDSIDFIGWYTHKSRKVNGTSLWAADHQYLNYHEGWYGYRKGSYKKKSWLLATASSVKRRASNYGEQLRKCNL
ncbi:hypothetical protein [Endozoicomonas ascidiicola]|uniref:transglycosylase SLT domain-containing protein n=1 Tax=Endozoicomonas ascidiicola TaxID=1698521 RepID=UPI000B229C34|nr:hypothetical protein [Endozoicomonas ascidiicola]